MNHIVKVFALTGIFLLGACNPSPDQTADARLLADFSGLGEGWNTIEPGGDTLCSDGTPYRFFVRPGDPEKLMFYLEGGGACWAGFNCDPDLRPSYQMNLARTDPAQAHGIFAFDQAANPFADYTVVMAPYCSGDVHLGDVDQQYQAPEIPEHAGHEVSIHHRGFINANAALQWTYERMFQPSRIFVTGSSAGSIPSPFYAVLMGQRYPQADIAQLGDASGGYRGFANFNPYESWRLNQVVDLPYLNDVGADDFSFHHLYLAAASAEPRIRFASFDTVEDTVQKQFLALGGNPTESLEPLLDANLEEISENIGNFRYFVAGGDVHTILLRPEFYRYSVGNQSLSEWVADLATGEAISNVRCKECSSPELTAE